MDIPWMSQLLCHPRILGHRGMVHVGVHGRFMDVLLTVPSIHGYRGVGEGRYYMPCVLPTMNYMYILPDTSCALYVSTIIHVIYSGLSIEDMGYSMT